ncbi:MAG: TolC family protein [Phycisphaeraceae bacterium]
MRTKTQSLTGCKASLGVLAMMGSFALAGCHGSVESLDQRVAEMIAERQKLALGAEGVSDAAVATPDDRTAVGLYDEQPATNNPAAGQLPAKPTAEAESEGIVVDPAFDGDSIKLDLPALLAYAIEHAPEYRREKEQLFLSTLSLIIERHLWGPRFFNTLSADLSGTPESGDYDTALDIVNDFTVTQRLPYGGTASVSALVNYTNLLQQASTTTTADELQSSSINASINLPLLRGAGMVAREDLIQAERDLIYAVRDFERFRREFFVDISSTYFVLLRQQRRIENQRQQIEGLERLAEEQAQLLEAGRIPGFEAADAEAQVLFGQSNLASVIDDYVSSLDSFKLRIGMPVSQPLDIVSAEIEVPRPALDSAESIKIGQAVRLDLQTTADQVDDARRSVKVARNQLRGDLDLNAGIDLNSDTDSDIDGLDLELGDSDYNVGLEYSVPLDRKIEFAQYRSALVDLERAERDYRVARDRVALDIRDASREIERATLTLTLQTRNVELAERRVENVKILRRRGEVPPRRLIEAEEDLLDARNRRDEALADLQTSVLNYLLQTGQMRVDAQGRWLAPGTLKSEAPDEQAPDAAEQAE